MEVSRYITIQAVITEENELIPLWDERVQFEKTEMYGNVIRINNSYKHQRLTECLFDLKTKTLSVGISIDIYPEKTEYKINQSVVYGEHGRGLQQTKVIDIKYEEYDIEIVKGKKIHDYYKKHIKDIDKNALYALKKWKPVYVLDNGIETQWSHQLYYMV
jgi:hypothetical protein